MASKIAPADATLLPPMLARDLSMRALERLAARLSTLDLTPLLVYDIDTVDASALPSLAEQFRVLGDAGYGFAANVEQQRALIKNAIALHSIRGTRSAIERVLALLGVTVTIAEWFEQTPQGAPYTFSIALDPLDQPAGSPALDTTRWAQIARLIDFWKNARSAFSLAAVSEGVGMGVGVSMIAGGVAAAQISAEFAGDDLALPLLVAMPGIGTESQTIEASFS